MRIRFIENPRSVGGRGFFCAEEEEEEEERVAVSRNGDVTEENAEERVAVIGCRCRGIRGVQRRGRCVTGAEVVPKQ